jgi:predicted aconitase
VPYITGLEKFLGEGISIETSDYLQEMGAGIATYGAVTLFHVEEITPEAVEQGRGLLFPEHKTFTITDEALNNQLDLYPLIWADEDARPEKCYIGCPHLSAPQLNWWSEKIIENLQTRNKARVSVETIICTAPQVLDNFMNARGNYQALLDAGVRFSPTCCETIFETGLCTGQPIITNSNKLRAYTSAKFYPDEDLVRIIVGGDHG